MRAGPRRIRLDLAYDGTDYSGWQVQPAARTLQGVLEAKLASLQGEGPVAVRGGGRTDAGVHARGQVADAWIAPRADDRKLRFALNGLIPADLRVRALATVDDEFHARHRAVSKTYRYRLDRSDEGDPFLARFALGLADACFAPASIAALDAELPRAAAAQDPRAALAELGRRHGLAPPPGELEALRPAIDRHFGQASVTGILESLASESRPEFQPWAAKTLALLGERSPTLLRVTFEQLRRGRGLPLADCFRLELNLIHGCFDQGDFVEGVRALMVDKDNAPRWNPSSLAHVTDASVEAFFAPRWRPLEHPLRHLQPQEAP